jgi:hypothetical protein
LLTRSTYPDWYRYHHRCNTYVGRTKCTTKSDSAQYHPRSLSGTISN